MSLNGLELAALASLGDVSSLSLERKGVYLYVEVVPHNPVEGPYLVRISPYGSVSPRYSLSMEA